MKKILLFVFGLCIVTPVFAVCPLDATTCSVAAYDQSVIRAPFKPIYKEIGGAVEFGDNPFIRLSPAERPELNRNFHMKNELEMNTDGYNSDCQFGVCLPDRNRFN